MKVYHYSEARQNLSAILNQSRLEPVLIRRRSGELFRVTPQPLKGSPLDIRGVRTRARTCDILAAIRSGRERLP